ncbi:hypothetical protein RyT2_19230 [Pseudolactococcus yaeyamensis]
MDKFQKAKQNTQDINLDELSLKEKVGKDLEESHKFIFLGVDANHASGDVVVCGFNPKEAAELLIGAAVQIRLSHGINIFDDDEEEEEESE